MKFGRRQLEPDDFAETAQIHATLALRAERDYVFDGAADRNIHFRCEQNTVRADVSR